MDEFQRISFIFKSHGPDQPDGVVQDQGQAAAGGRIGFEVGKDRTVAEKISHEFILFPDRCNQGEVRRIVPKGEVRAGLNEFPEEGDSFLNICHRSTFQKKNRQIEEFAIKYLSVKQKNIGNSKFMIMSIPHFLAL